MSTTFAGSPLRTSLSMLSEDHLRLDPSTVVITTEGDHQPLGYLYSSFDLCTHQADADDGFYDPESQTWVGPGGIIAGVGTYTRTGGCGCDCVQDDACR